MQVKDGWATDYGRDRYDVLIEEVDVAKILAEYGLPAGAENSLTISEKFQLMTGYARMYALTAQQRIAAEPLAASSAVAQARDSLNHLVGQIKARLGLGAPVQQPYQETREQPAAEPAAA